MLRLFFAYCKILNVVIAYILISVHWNIFLLVQFEPCDYLQTHSQNFIGTN